MSGFIGWLALACLWHVCGCGAHFGTEDEGPAPPHRELKIFQHWCAMKKDEGPCKAAKERFYFNTDTALCEPFEYGGCGGNANNFESVEQCEEACMNTPGKSPCHLEEAPGPCRGLVKRYFYNSQSQRCEHFLYGGCFGNANNFRSLKECQDRCPMSGDPSQHSTRSITTAPSKASAAPSDGSLVIGGDTAVNMSHVEAQKLELTDSTIPELCFIPADRGTCEGSIKRFLYNSRRKRCQIFLYSGCEGNRNNFPSRKQCTKTCMPSLHAHTGPKQIRVKKKFISRP